MTPLEPFLRIHGETLLYIVFFGSIIALGLLEVIVEMRAGHADRRRRWPVNWGLTILNIVLLGLLPLSALIFADYARDNGIGLMNFFDIPLWVAVIVAILVFSFQSWAVHYAMHYVPILWRLHRVHHTDRHMDISTTVRFHPFEFLVQAPISALIVLAMGAPPVAVIVYELLDAAINVFSHSNIRLPHWLDRFLSRIIVTPHVHRIHHSTRVAETNSNFGATLPIWDMLMGTYRRKTANELAEQPIGLDEMQDARATSLWWAITLPFRDIHQPAEPPFVDDPERTEPL